eukprot:CAMPEP_0117596732 /NCGR_PEP_ID=MMETSP0784-20121206/74474_1 /TAXON_ID=39447 /ORGANISM="" /LENGTH=507 /DNA_ID=CAMNT_0005399043 /DNA_START=251 /DNA_END=1770 /DNA_ORIENTATION=-
MSYFMLVTPVLLNKADPKAPPDFPSLITATAFSASIGSFVAGTVANAPVGVVPGLRLNAYFTFVLCHSLGVSWGKALSCAFVSGLLLLVLAVLGVCDWIARTVLSDHLKKSITVAMGIFQAIIGFQMMGVEVTQHHALADLQCGEQKLILTGMQCSTVGICLSLLVFCVISGLLAIERANGALFTGIVLSAISSWIIGLATPPDTLFDSPRFDLFLSLDFSAWFGKIEELGVMITGSMVFLFVALTDIAAVQYGLYGIAGLLRFDGVPGSRGIVSGVAVGTMVGALLGTSPLVIANESSAGIMEGARTGLSAVVVSALFLLSAFLTPLLSSIPDIAAAAPIVLTGVFMMEPCRRIAWDNLRVAIPSFVVILVVPYRMHIGISGGIFLDLFLGFISQCSQLAHHTSAENAEADPTPWIRGPAPHAVTASSGLTEKEKVEWAMQLLRDLGPPCSNRHRPETWEIALRQALDLYIHGMQSVLADRNSFAYLVSLDKRTSSTSSHAFENGG